MEHLRSLEPMLRQEKERATELRMANQQVTTRVMTAKIMVLAMMVILVKEVVGRIVTMVITRMIVAVQVTAVLDLGSALMRARTENQQRSPATRPSWHCKRS